MVSPIKSTSNRDLILHCNGEQNYIEVLPHHTLSDVRQLVLQELDPEQLPSSCNNGGGDPEFSFRVDNIRISEKQEKKKMAFNLIERGERVEIVPKKADNKRALDDVEECEVKNASKKTAAIAAKAGSDSAKKRGRPKVTTRSAKKAKAITAKASIKEVLKKLPENHKKRATKALESLSKGWIPEPYHYNNK